MLRGFGLGAVVLVAAAAAAALAHPAPVASAAAAAPHVVATSQGWIDVGITLGGGRVALDGSGAPSGLKITVALLEAGKSSPLTHATAAEDGRFHATALLPNGVQPGLPATFHTCYELAARKIDFCSDTVMQVPPVPRTS